MKRHLTLLLLALTALTLLIAACGDDDDSDGVDEPTSTSETDDEEPTGDDEDASTDDPDATPSDDDPDATPEDDEQADSDDCELVSGQVVESALGEAVELQSGEDAETCIFVSEDFTSVEVFSASLGETGEAVFAATRDAFEGEEEVAGIGDEAFWVPDLNQLNVREGNEQLVVTIVQADEGTDTKAAATQIAEAALENVG